MCCIAVSYCHVTFPCSRHDIGNMVHSTRQSLFMIDLHDKNIFDTKKYMFGCMLAPSRLLVWLRANNTLRTVVD
jgi:hypothetical protein